MSNGPTLYPISHFFFLSPSLCLCLLDVSIQYSIANMLVNITNSFEKPDNSEETEQLKKLGLSSPLLTPMHVIHHGRACSKRSLSCKMSLIAHDHNLIHCDIDALCFPWQRTGKYAGEHIPEPNPKDAQEYINNRSIALMLSIIPWFVWTLNVKGVNLWS